MSVRQKKLLLADTRAMEKEVNREVDKPTMPIEASPLRGGALVGAGSAGAGSHCEARGYGKTLGKHLLGVYGMGYGKEFATGMADAFADNVEAKQMATPRLGRTKKGAGALEIEINHMKDSESEGEKKEMKGGIGSGRYEGEGMGDKRKARAQVVRRIMMERKVSLPEASRIVKAEGLF